MENLFEKFLFEAPDDDPPDIAETGPPDMPDVAADEPSNSDTGNIQGDDPPDDMGGEDFGDGDFGDMDGNGDGTDNTNPNEELQLDDKVSAIMNRSLYQRFLSLLNSLTSQITMIKNNGDILYALSPNSSDMLTSLNKLEENIRLYLKNTFIHEDYSKNRLFFDECINLLKLLNITFDKDIKKGIHSVE